MKSKLATIVFAVCICACTPRASQTVDYDGKRPRPNLEHPDLDLDDQLGSVQESEAPQLKSSERIIQIGNKLTLREKAATRLTAGKSTTLLRNKDRSCGLIKVIEVIPNVQMKVNYIFLAKKGDIGEALAEKVIEEYQNGTSFSDLAKQYSKDSGSQNGGELDWFKETSMVKGFTEAIRNHSKGEIYKANTDEYGWYVIEHTHDTIDETEFKILEVTGYQDCN